MSFLYTHLSPDWPNYRWDRSRLALDLAKLHFRRRQLIAAMATLGFEIRQEAVLQVLVQDITKSSEIEGEKLDAAQVRSSIARKLCMEYVGLPIPEHRVEGVVEMMLDATQRFQVPLSDERIFSWHGALFPTGRTGLNVRQSKVINMLFEGFFGKLQSTKYGEITKCSQYTALRDLADLINKGILLQEGSERSTSYVLAA